MAVVVVFSLCSFAYGMGTARGGRLQWLFSCIRVLSVCVCWLMAVCEILGATRVDGIKSEIYEKNRANRHFFFALITFFLILSFIMTELKWLAAVVSFTSPFSSFIIASFI